MQLRHCCSCAILALVAMGAAPALATDTDPPDCQSNYTDFGDAPEAIPCYPSGVLGHFPTCLVATAPGTQEVDCPGAALSTPPGPTGFVMHQALPGLNFWFGCYPGPQGVDSEPDAKVGIPAGPPMCFQGPPDCIEAAFGGMQFFQDECFGDGSDAGLMAIPALVACQPAHLDVAMWNCGAPVQVFVNALIDWNGDGDWNDVIRCSAATCAPEWVIKNVPFMLPPGCTQFATPAFTCGPSPGPTWLRITLSYEPANDDYPWAGTATEPGSIFHGGETEDYPLVIAAAVPTRPTSWGRVKVLYRS